MTNEGRKTYIEFGIKNNVPVTNINNALIESGFNPLSKTEAMEINDGTFGKGLLPKLGKGVTDIGGGLFTILGGAGEYLRSPNVRQEVNQAVGNYLQDKTTSDVLADAVNLMGIPYNNLTIDKALSQPLSETLTDITSGVQAHPLDATLDFVLPSLGGASKLLKGTKAGRKLGQKAIEAVDNSKLPNILKSTIKGTRQAQINDILNTAKYAPSYKMEQLGNANTAFKTSHIEDLEQAIKNLEEGTRNGTKAQVNLTEQLQNFSKQVDDMMIEKGLQPDTIRSDAVSQFVTRQLQKDNLDIPVAEIKRYMKDTNYVPEGLDKNKIAQLVNEGETLYNQGLIYPVRHKTTTKMAREGLLSEETKRLFGKNERIYGTQSYQDLAKEMKTQGFSDILGKLNKSERALGAIDEINLNLGRKVDDVNNLKLADNEVVISPRLLREKMGTSIIQGGDINNDIKTLSRGLNKEELAKYADDLYIYNKDDLKALEKAYIPSKNKVDTLTKFAKRAALSTPRYIVGNTTTNIGMNLTEGVSPLHYVEAFTNRDLIPKALTKSTTYSGYLGDEVKGSSKLKEIYKDLFDKVQTGTPVEKLEALQQMSTTPIFKSAGSIEWLDRSANYLYQAEKYAKETNKTVEEILTLAKQNNGNNKTYRELISRVNNTLGDYTGRNYYAPESLNEILGGITPFYRPYTQGARQFLHQAINNPFYNQLINRNPARLGNQISSYSEQELNVTPSEEYSGGFPVLPRLGNMPSRVAGNQYHAYSALGQLFNSPTDVLGGNLMPLAPVLGLAGLNRYGKAPTLPNQAVINGKKVQLDNNGNEVKYNEFQQNLQLALAQSLQSYVAPINQLNSFILPAIAGFTDQEYRRPVDTALLGQIGNFKIPNVIESDPNARAKVGIENLLPMLGFTYIDTYKDRDTTMRERARALRKLSRKEARNSRR